MNTKSMLAALAGGVTLFILGYLFYGLALASFFASHAGTATGFMKEMEDVNLIAVFLGNLSGAVFLTIMFGNWASVKTFADGAKSGAIFGLLVALAVDLIMFGTTNASDLTATLVDPIVNAVMFGIGGGVVGMMLGRGGSSDD